jgi:hypothetical protein
VGGQPHAPALYPWARVRDTRFNKGLFIFQLKDDVTVLQYL